VTGWRRAAPRTASQRSPARAALSALCCATPAPCRPARAAAPAAPTLHRPEGARQRPHAVTVRATRRAAPLMAGAPNAEASPCSTRSSLNSRIRQRMPLLVGSNWASPANRGGRDRAPSPSLPHPVLWTRGCSMRRA
jgi:hypothetical protein